jgi:pantetheine-phosphate adenylyltransferase
MENSHQEPRIAVFPGSFDPITVGHEAIIRRALTLFDKVIVAIGHNTTKKSLFPLERRIEWIKTALQDKSDVVEVQSFTGLTIDFCKKMNARFIVRGLRTSTDFEFEYSTGQVNRQIGGIETILLLTDPQYTHISSGIVRDIFLYGGALETLIPKGIKLTTDEK